MGTGQGQKTVGRIVGGDSVSLEIEGLNEATLELDELLVSENSPSDYTVLKINGVRYGTSVSNEIPVKAVDADHKADTPVRERDAMFYMARPVLRYNDGRLGIPKVIPAIWSQVRRAEKHDFEFLTNASPDTIFIGKIRSGSRVLDIDIRLNGRDLLTHHVMIPATTGRGKSNLVKVMLWSILNSGRFGILLLDSHDEYYGRTGHGLREHPYAGERLAYYSTDSVPGSYSLVINLESIEPDHFEGILSFTEAQKQAISLYHRTFREKWIEAMVKGKEIRESVSDITVRVIQRKLRRVLGIYEEGGKIRCENSVFSADSGTTTLRDIVRFLESGKTVILDTSRLGDDGELLIGSIVAGRIFSLYRNYKGSGELDTKAPVSIVIEEAPRILSEEKIAEEGNIYSTIAREGRKFNVGLIAITQLTSVIPRTILSNINTKIILGNEMAIEREAIINSAVQDLSDQDRSIASLDKGEAIVSSIFTRFAVPVYTPEFQQIVESSEKPMKHQEGLIM